MNLGEIRTLVRNLLDEPSEGFWTDTELNIYINAAYEHYYLRIINSDYAGVLTTRTSLNIVAATDTVALPSDFLKHKKLERVFDTYKVPIDYNERHEMGTQTSGADSGNYLPTWQIVGSDIVLEPPPSTSASNGLLLWYYPELTELSADGDTPVTGFRKNWHKMLAVKACVFAKGLKEEESDDALIRMLITLEDPFETALQRLVVARQYVEPDYRAWEGY